GIRRGDSRWLREHSRRDRGRPGARTDRGICVREQGLVFRRHHLPGVHRGHHGPSERPPGRADGEPTMTARRAAHSVGLVTLLVLPNGLSAYGIHIANLVLIFAMLAVGLSIVLGHAGQVNLAQAAFFGMGAYA